MSDEIDWKKSKWQETIVMVLGRLGSHEESHANALMNVLDAAWSAGYYDGKSEGRDQGRKECIKDYAPPAIDELPIRDGAMATFYRILGRASATLIVAWGWLMLPENVVRVPAGTVLVLTLPIAVAFGALPWWFWRRRA